VKRLVLKVIPDETTRLAALKRGEVDVVYSIRGERFPSGIAEINLNGTKPGYYDVDPDNPESASDGLDRICRNWRDHGTEDALVLVVGATDRVPLGTELHNQYEANTGLAMARAVEVRDYLKGLLPPRRPRSLLYGISIANVLVMSERTRRITPANSAEFIALLAACSISRARNG
jgi:hypothetical protein